MVWLDDIVLFIKSELGGMGNFLVFALLVVAVGFFFQSQLTVSPRNLSGGITLMFSQAFPAMLSSLLASHPSSPQAQLGWQSCGFKEGPGCSSPDL